MGPEQQLVEQLGVEQLRGERRAAHTEPFPTSHVTNSAPCPAGYGVACGVPEVGRLSCCAFVFVDEAAEDVTAVEVPRCG
jgi:hypothetical protein